MNRFFIACCLFLISCRSEGKVPPVEPKPLKEVNSLAPPRPIVTDITAQDYLPPVLPHSRISILTGASKTVLVDAEVAFKNAHRTRGLMWRTQLPEGTGMLFIFPHEEPLSFWMRNTLIPLDMIFIGADKQVVNVIAQAEPKTLVGRPSSAPALYVLEVPGGWCQKVGITAGVKMEFEGIEKLVVE